MQPHRQVERSSLRLIRIRLLLFLPIRLLRVFERHALQFISCGRIGRKLRLLMAQQCERATGAVGAKQRPMREWLLRFATRECVSWRGLKSFAPDGKGLAQPIEIVGLCLFGRV